MMLIIVLFWFSNYVYVPIFSTYCTSVGAPLAMTGIIIGSYGLTQMLLRLPIGIVSDMLRNRRLFLFLGTISSLLSSAGLYFFTSPLLLLLFRAMAGLTASHWAIYITTYSGLGEEEDSGRSLGIVNALMALGQILATFSGGLAAEYIGVKSTFLISAGAALIGLILLLFIPETYEAQDQKVSISDFTSLFRDSKLLFYSFMGLFFQYIHTSSLLGFVPSLLEAIGASDFEKGLGTTLALIPGIIGGPLAMSLLSRRLGIRRMGIIGFLLLSVPMFFFPFIKSIPLMLFAEFITGFGKGTLMPLFMAGATSHLPSDTHSTAFSVYQAVYGIGMWIGPSISGYISNLFSIKAAFICLGFVGAAAIIILFAHKEEKIIVQ